MKKIELIEQDIAILNNALENGNIEEVIKSIILVYEKDIPNIQGIFDQEEHTDNFFGIPTYTIVYNENCVKRLINLLVKLKVDLEDKKENLKRENGKNIINVSATSIANVTVNIDVSKIIESLNELNFSKEELEDIEDTLTLVEKEIKRGNKTKAKEKLVGALKYIGDKGIDVAIAFAPMLFRISQMS